MTGLILALLLFMSADITLTALSLLKKGRKGKRGERGPAGPPGLRGESNKCCANCAEGKAGECYVWKPREIFPTVPAAPLAPEAPEASGSTIPMEALDAIPGHSMPVHTGNVPFQVVDVAKEQANAEDSVPTS